MGRSWRTAFAAAIVFVVLAALGPAPASAVDGVPTSWKMVSARGATSCAIDATDALYCWGDNGLGQVGDGTTDNVLSPKRVGSNTWRSVSTSDYTTCGIRTDRTAYCWGYNADGQTGTGLSAPTVTKPTRVTGTVSWAKMSPGFLSSCGTSTAGSLYCWGSNKYGGVGDGSTTDRPTPVRVGSGAVWSVVSVGYYHACGRTTSSQVRCWGYGAYGSLGNGGTDDVGVPTAVPGRFSKLSVTAYSSCAVTTGGISQCWGYNDYGNLGDGTTTQRNSPTTLTVGSKSFATLLSGRTFSCGVTASQAKVRCFGDNAAYEFGNGTTTSSLTPTDAAGGLLDWAKVSVGDMGVCALRSSGSLYCWGDNSYGQLEVGTTDAYDHRVRVGRTPSDPVPPSGAGRIATGRPAARA